MSHAFNGLSTRFVETFKFLPKWLYLLEADITPTEYMSTVFLNMATFFFFGLALVYAVAMKAAVANPIYWSLGGAFLVSITVGVICTVYPKWLANKKVNSIDRDLLFAARHLRVQTTAGVPLFESLVSASHGYGAVSMEIDKIVTSVQAGTNLADALEDSAVRNPSYYYSRIMWQVSNAVKAGSDIGPVLSDIVDFLADEQRIEMRSYGAQLNTLAILYLMVCIIVPTVSLIFLMVISSFISLPITDSFLSFIIGAMIFVQYMFIGLIESRRPVVSI